jgi:hypothetical protein
MRAANQIVILLVGSLLGSCQRAEPDFTFSLESPDGSRTAVFRGYEPGGTIESNLVLSFRGTGTRSATFREIENGRIGWVGTDTLTVVADKIQYYGLDSDYFPDGTIGNKVRVITCSRQYTSCLDVMKQLEKAKNVKSLRHFPRK